MQGNDDLNGRSSSLVVKTFTGSGALSQVLSGWSMAEIVELRIHVDIAAVTDERLTIMIDSGVGPQFDVILKSIAMAGVNDYVWIPEISSIILGRDKMVLSWPNSDGRTWGLTVVYRRVS